MKTATVRATYDFVYFLNNYGGKSNHLRDAELINNNNYSVEFWLSCVTIHCQCDHTQPQIDCPEFHPFSSGHPTCTTPLLGTNYRYYEVLHARVQSRSVWAASCCSCSSEEKGASRQTEGERGVTRLPGIRRAITPRWRPEIQDDPSYYCCQGKSSDKLAVGLIQSDCSSFVNSLPEPTAIWPNPW